MALVYRVNDWVEDRHTVYIFKIVGMFSAKGNRYVQISLIGQLRSGFYKLTETKGYRTHSIEGFHRKFKCADTARLLYGDKA